MATLGLVEYDDASPEVRAIYDDIMATRKTDWINNFWKALARDPVTLRRTWESIKQIMGPGALDPLIKELIYVAVSTTNQCGYCIASHTAGARKAGMTDAMFVELMAVVGMANETNRLASGYQVESDPRASDNRAFCLTQTIKMLSPAIVGKLVAWKTASLHACCMRPPT